MLKGACGPAYPKQLIRKCPSCGTYYFYEMSLWHNGDYTHLDLDRFTDEQTRFLEPLFLSDDENVLYKSLDAAFSHKNKEEIANKAENIFYEIIYWKLGHSSKQINILTKLLYHSNIAARIMAARTLLNFKGEVKIDPKIIEKCEEILK